MSEERKRQAFSLYVRGKSKTEIASVLGSTSATVSRWIEEQKGINHTVTQRVKKEDHAGIVMQRFADLRNDIYTELENASKPGDKAKFLKLAMELELKETGLLQDLGLLETEARKQELSVSVVHQLKSDVGLGRLDALAVAMISKRTGMAANQVMAMQGAHKNVLAMPEPVGLKEHESPEPSPVIDADFTEPVNGKANGHTHEGEE